jgi:5-methylcytosine-specific restriction endonuclease McrA
MGAAIPVASGSPTQAVGSIAIPDEKKRDIPLKLRLKVLDRDNYSCKYCGRSPALCAGIVLHVDHRIPYARGGKTELTNLQTLCGECNLGKGDSAVGADA